MRSRSRSRCRSSRVHRIHRIITQVVNGAYVRFCRNVSSGRRFYLSERERQRSGRLLIKRRRSRDRRSNMRNSQDSRYDRRIRMFARESSAHASICANVLQRFNRMLCMLCSFLGWTYTRTTRSVVGWGAFQTPCLFRGPSRRPCHGRVGRSINRSPIRGRMDR